MSSCQAYRWAQAGWRTSRLLLRCFWILAISGPLGSLCGCVSDQPWCRYFGNRCSSWCSWSWEVQLHQLELAVPQLSLLGLRSKRMFQRLQGAHLHFLHSFWKSQSNYAQNLWQGAEVRHEALVCYLWLLEVPGFGPSSSSSVWIWIASSAYSISNSSWYLPLEPQQYHLVAERMSVTLEQGESLLSSSFWCSSWSIGVLLPKSGCRFAWSYWSFPDCLQAKMGLCSPEQVCEEVQTHQSPARRLGNPCSIAGGWRCCCPLWWYLATLTDWMDQTLLLNQSLSI